MGRRTNVTTYKDIVSNKPPANTDYWGKRLLSPRCVTLLMGKAGAAKSMLALNLAGALLDNKDFLGFPCRGEHIVAYLNTEIDDELMYERMTMLSSKYTFNNFYQLKSVGYDYDFYEGDEDIDDVVSVLRELKATVVIIDCFYNLHTADENSEKEMKIVMRKMRKIQEESDIAIVLVHHTDKQGNGSRGSSAIDGWVWNMLKISSSKGGTNRKLSFPKVRGAQQPEDIPLELCVESLELTAKTREQKKKNISSDIVKFMIERLMTTATFSELAKMRGVKVNSIYVKLCKHKDKGYYDFTGNNVEGTVTLRKEYADLAVVSLLE